MERLYALAAGRDYLNPVTQHLEMSAERIIAGLKKFHVIPHTQAEYAAMTPKDKAVLKKESGFLIGGHFGGFKTKADCKYRSIVTLDLDALTPETAAESIERLKTYGRGVIYSTASHRPEKPRLRAFIFLSRDVTPDEYVQIIRGFAAALPEGVISSETYKPSQLMYRPQRCVDGEEVFIEIPGEPWDPTYMLAHVPPPPERKSEATPAWEKPGIVGAVARLYEGDFDRAIEELGLPYRRSMVGPTCGEGEDRYTYTKGSGADGAIWYAGDGHLWSHHGTDPARDQNATIFDVWRLHNAEPDKDDPNAPIQDRASHRTAQDWFIRRFPQLQGEVWLPADVSELDDLGPPERPLEAVEEAVKAAIEPATPMRFQPIPAAEFSAGKPQPWQIKGILPETCFAVFYGASGSGKSFIVYEMACCVALGVPFRGHKVKPGRVLWLAAEGAGGLKARILAYSQDRGVSMQDLPAVMPYAPNLLEVHDTADLIKAMRAWGKVDVIVIDTLSATTPGSDENAGKDMGRVVSHVNAIIRITKAAVWLIHHSGKDAARGARGWSGLRAAADVELEVTRAGDIRMLKHTKSKDGKDGTQYAFRLKVVQLGIDDDGDEINSCVVEEVDLQPQGLGGRKLTPEQRKAYDAAVECISECGDKAPRADVVSAIAATRLDLENDESRKKFAARVMKVLTEANLLFWADGGNSITTTRVIELEEEE